MFQKWIPKSNQTSNVLFTAGPKARTLQFFVVEVAKEVAYLVDSNIKSIHHVLVTFLYIRS